MNRTLIWLIAFFMVSCVSVKKFNDMQGKLGEEKIRLNQQVVDLTTRNTELNGLYERSLNQKKAISDELEQIKLEKEQLSQLKENLERERVNIERQYQVLKKGTSSEIEGLLNELQQARGDLNQREDKLRESEKVLKEKNLKLLELQEILRQKEEAVKLLKQKVTDALVGFQNNGLSVFEKNGKVYVSLEERLLFKSGQWDVDPRGQQAIKDLAAVLAQNKDINIMVEGHTDDVPMHGVNQVKDNWDLSVMRATAVTKVLLLNKQIDPVRIISAGRSEYLPLETDKTAESRQKNRRTEIILTPRLDEILKLLESN